MYLFTGSFHLSPCAVLILGLTIERFCMTGGESPIGYLTAYLTNLYLSADCDKVQEAIQAGLNLLSFVICWYLLLSLLSLLKNYIYTHSVSFLESSAASSNAESHHFVWCKVITYFYSAK